MNQHTGDLSSTERATSALIGLSFALVALRRGNLLWRMLTGVAGVTLLARSLTGNSLTKGASVRQTSRSYEDAVDESVQDTFPASDPPASHLADVPPSNAEAKWEAARAAEKNLPG
jgi:uncharacterized membrane protein